MWTNPNVTRRNHALIDLLYIRAPKNPLEHVSPPCFLDLRMRTMQLRSKNINPQSAGKSGQLASLDAHGYSILNSVCKLTLLHDQLPFVLLDNLPLKVTE